MKLTVIQHLKKGKKEYDLWFGHGPKLFSNGVPLHDDCYRFSKKKLKFDNFINKKGDDMGGFNIKGLDYKPIKNIGNKFLIQKHY